MNFKPFSEKQLLALSWWCADSPYRNCSALICDGAVRSGKTFCMTLSFAAWSFYRFREQSFAFCGRTVRSLRRNIITPLMPVLSQLGFEIKEYVSQNMLEITFQGAKNRFYLFGGRDESSASLIQGMTLAGVLFDEVALMPRSFVEQALARCSVENSVFWFNCNPEYPRHWFYTQWILKAKQKNALYLHFTMEDNPSLSEKMRERYKALYSGAFYDRFVLGRWTAQNGCVYPFMDKDEMYFEVPRGEASEYAVSCDYGTVNPASFGLWGRFDGVWYRIREYYYNSRTEGVQRTDEEHYRALRELTGAVQPSVTVVDPSAASFITLIRQKGEFNVIPAKNQVVDGIRQTFSALKEQRIRICKSCDDARREFSLYRWEEGAVKDSPVKENDHAMDDIRYFVTSVLNRSGGFCAVAAAR